MPRKVNASDLEANWSPLAYPTYCLDLVQVMSPARHRANRKLSSVHDISDRAYPRRISILKMRRLCTPVILCFASRLTSFAFVSDRGHWHAPPHGVSTNLCAYISYKSSNAMSRWAILTVLRNLYHKRRRYMVFLGYESERVG